MTTIANSIPCLSIVGIDIVVYDKDCQFEYHAFVFWIIGIDMVFLLEDSKFNAMRLRLTFNTAGAHSF